MRKMLKRTVAAAVVAAPMTMALSGLASADTYGQTSQHAGADGAMTSSQQANTGGKGGSGGGHGGASYDKNWQHAGPDGAASSGTHAATGKTGGSHESGGLLSSLL